MRAIREISAQYFGYQSAARHRKGCPRAGTDAWEVTRHTWESFDGKTVETTFRFACFECGAVEFVGFDGELNLEVTSVADIGFGSRPEQVAGLWLHPGPRFLRGDEHGPYAFYVTRSKDRPRTPADVLGVVGWHFGKRLGIKWSAGLGATERGNVKTPAGQDFTSKRSAVAWIAQASKEPELVQAQPASAERTRRSDDT